MTMVNSICWATREVSSVESYRKGISDELVASLSSLCWGAQQEELWFAAEDSTKHHTTLYWGTKVKSQQCLGRLLYFTPTPEGVKFLPSTLSRWYTERDCCFDLPSFIQFMDSCLCTLPRGVGVKVRWTVWSSFSLSLSLLLLQHTECSCPCLHTPLLLSSGPNECDAAEIQWRVTTLPHIQPSTSKRLNVRPFDQRLHLLCAARLSAPAHSVL